MLWVNIVDDKSKDKLKSHSSINFDGTVDLTVASNAHTTNGTLADAGVAHNTSNLNGARISLNNNNNTSIHDKNAAIAGSDDDGKMTKANGDGDGTNNNNNGQILDNFANFDAFSSLSQKDFDPFASADFPDTIGLNSTQIDGFGGGGAKTVGAHQSKSASAAAKDRFFADSLSNTPTTRLTHDNGDTNGRSTKGVSINDYFDAKFDSFMTATKPNSNIPNDDLTPKLTTIAADVTNANAKSKASPFGLDDDGFADFSNANIFKATFDTIDSKTTSAQFDLAFQPSPSKTNKTASAFLPLPPPIGKTKSTTKTKPTTTSPPAAAAPTAAVDCDNKKNVTATDTENVPTKFRNDYSKTDQFEDDLEEVLKRSLVDQ